MALALSAGAQSIQHTKWKAYFLVMGDSVTLSFTADSMTVKSDSGHVLLQSGFKDSGTVVTVDDYGGICACPNFPGKYQAKITADTLIMVPANDICDIRNSILMAKWWVRVHEPPVGLNAAKPGQPGKKKRGR